MLQWLSLISRFKINLSLRIVHMVKIPYENQQKERNGMENAQMCSLVKNSQCALCTQK